MRHVLKLAAFLLLTALPASAGAELVLVDGQVVEGVSVERREALYLLELKNGEVLPVPLELVLEMRLTGEDDPDATGLVDAQGRTLVGPPTGPDLPKAAEQLQVFREQPGFQRGPIDPTWRPKSAWDYDASANEFHPARWYQPPLDPSWKPRSAYKQSMDVTAFNPARWYVAPIDSTWRPDNAFGATRWFAPIVKSRR